MTYRNSHWPRSWQDLKPIRAGVTANLGECWITEMNKLYLFNFFLLRTVSVPEFAGLEWRTINASSKRKNGRRGLRQVITKQREVRTVSERASDFRKKSIRLLLTLPVTFKVTCWLLEWIFASALTHMYDWFSRATSLKEKAMVYNHLWDLEVRNITSKTIWMSLQCKPTDVSVCLGYICWNHGIWHRHLWSENTCTRLQCHVLSAWLDTY